MTCHVRAWDNEEQNIDFRGDSDWAKGREGETTSGGMMMVHRTAVKHWSWTQSQGTSPLSHKQLNGWECNVVLGSGLEGRGQNVDGLQRGKSDSFQKRLGEHKAHRVEILDIVEGAANDLFWKSENPVGASRIQSGGSVGEGCGVA